MSQPNRVGRRINPRSLAGHERLPVRLSHVASARPLHEMRLERVEVMDKELNKARNSYSNSAHLYDLDDRGVTKDDIPFYLEYAAKTSGGDILELACGTGRVTIPLAKAGNNVWGIDLSENMLGQMKNKLNMSSQEIAKRVHISKMDMCSFVLHKKFSLIIIPFRAFQALTSLDQQNKCLTSIYRHLTDGGILILDVFKPKGQLDESWIYPEITQWEVFDPKTGYRIRKNHRGQAIDIERQIIYPEFIYHIVKPDGEEIIREQLELKYYYYDQIKDLLETQGFEIMQEFGYYDKRPITEGPEMVFVCKRK